MSQALLIGGNSATAQYVADKLFEHQQFLHKSAAVGMGGVIREELAEVWDECRVPDWDGYQGLPVSWDAYRNARRFLLALPLGVRVPTVGAEPAGNVTLEWHHSRRRSLSVSISPNNELYYAALLGPDRACGTVIFYDEVPDTILDLIERVYSC